MSADNLESTQFSLTNLSLISSTGKTIDIKYMCQDLNIYEDIFSSCVTGDIKMKDAQNLPVALDMHGNEYVYIDIETPTLQPIKKYFRVYKITDLNFQNPTTFEYTIHFCSDEFVLNQQMLISKSYKNIKNSDMVSDILKNKLKVAETKIAKIEDTKSQENIIVPNMKPFEAINWISSFSINPSLTSAYVFYESTQGFNFVSLEYLFKQTPYKNVTISPKNVQGDDDKATANHYIADRFEIKQSFDILETISSGGYSSNMLKLNLAGYQYTNSQFDIINNKFYKLNENLITNDGRNRLNKTLTNGSAYMRYFPRFQGDLTDKWLLQRAAQFSLLNSFRMNIQLSGDSQMRAGTVIELDFPLVQPTDESSKITQDYHKSGKYLVTSLRHRIFENKYFNYMEICKDSLKGAIPGATNNPSYQEANKS